MTELLVSELFYSIQGESTWAGLPCLFIRLATCNLRCRYCDASYTWDQHAANSMPVEAILRWVNEQRTSLVEITGGEPLWQAGCFPLIHALLATGKEVLVETNGSQPLEWVPLQAHVIVDIKCPGSGMAAWNLPKNPMILQQRWLQGAKDEIKFVLSSAADFHWAHAFILQHSLEGKMPLLFSPVQPLLPPAELAELMLRHAVQARLQLQLHSLIWPGIQRGI